MYEKGSCNIQGYSCTLSTKFFLKGEESFWNSMCDRASSWRPQTSLRPGAGTRAGWAGCSLLHPQTQTSSLCSSWPFRSSVSVLAGLLALCWSMRCWQALLCYSFLQALQPTQRWAPRRGKPAPTAPLPCWAPHLLSGSKHLNLQTGNSSLWFCLLVCFSREREC